MLGATFTIRIQQVFAHAAAAPGSGCVGTVAARRGLPRFRAGDHPPGHDPARVPEVPAAEVEIRRGAEQARILFTYKVEYGYPPDVVLDVRRDWGSVVALPGHVLLDGQVVLDVCDRDRAGRPATIRTAVVGGFFDTSMHGWRADAHTYYAHVSWDDRDEYGAVPTVDLGDFIE